MGYFLHTYPARRPLFQFFKIGANLPLYIHNSLTMSFSVQYKEQNQAILLHELHWKLMHENEASPASSLCRYNLILDDSLKRREPQLLRCSSTIYSSLKTRHPLLHRYFATIYASLKTRYPLLHRYVCVFLSPPPSVCQKGTIFPDFFWHPSLWGWRTILLLAILFIFLNIQRFV